MSINDPQSERQVNAATQQVRLQQNRDQTTIAASLIVRGLRFLGSAAFATVVIALVAAVLAWATWLESRFGTEVVQFGVYRSTWFAMLLCLLGVNVLSAALVRFPWRKKQIGFLLVHAGILLLLIGCWMTRQDSVDGHMSLLEGEGSSTVYESGMHFELAIVSTDDISTGDEEADAHTLKGNIASVNASTDKGQAELLNIPFRPGPFNWEEYQRLCWFPWSLIDFDQGVLFDNDGVKLEVLDYYSDSQRINVPELTLRAARGLSPDKREDVVWEKATLAVRLLGDRFRGSRGGTSIGDWRELSHGEIVQFSLSENPIETEAFLDSRPVGPLGRWGQIVLYVGGNADLRIGGDTRATNGSPTSARENIDDSITTHANINKYHLLVEDLEKGKPINLGDSGLAVELLEFDRDSLQVALSVFRDANENNEEKPTGVADDEAQSPQLSIPALSMNLPTVGKPANSSGTDAFATAQGSLATSSSRKRLGTLVLHAFATSRDRQDRKNGIYGTYWFDPENADADNDEQSEPRSFPAWIAAVRPRLDIIQGHDRNLYYRAWRAPRLISAGELPTDGSATVVFPSDNASGRSVDNIPMTVYVESLTPALRPGVEIRPRAFDKDRIKTPRVKMRLSVDGASSEFWLAKLSDAKADDERRRLVVGDKKMSGGIDSQQKRSARGAAVQLVGDTRELGFRVVLDDFQRRLDPGTSRASGYSSHVTFVETNPDDVSKANVLEKDVVVSLNRPADFTDPSDGRTYRFFQSAFSGPYTSGDLPIDEMSSDGKLSNGKVYRSTFSVSSDPGRQLKYAGCLMIVAGIVVMYYMKAYFFSKRNTKANFCKK